MPHKYLFSSRQTGSQDDGDALAQKLRDMGYQDVRLMDTLEEAFGFHTRAVMMMLENRRDVVMSKLGVVEDTTVRPHAGQNLCQRALPADLIRSKGAGAEGESAVRSAEVE